MIDAELAQQLRVRSVLQVALAQIGAWMDRHDPHLPHVAPYGVFVNAVSFPIHDGGNRPVAHEHVLVYNSSIRCLRRISSGDGGTGL